MRSSTGPLVVILGLAAMLVLVLLLVQSIGLRGDLDAAREEIVALESEVAAVERGVPMSELSMRLAELENNVREWVVTFSEDGSSGGDPTTPAGGSVSNAELLERIDRVLERIEELDQRIDEICESVPVC